MSIQVKFRRGTATQHGSFTGANGEITVDTTNKTLRVHDGVTVGGERLAKFSDLSGITANVSAYLQVANAVATYQTKSTELAHLANTNAYIATKADTSALTVVYNNVMDAVSTRATWTALKTTNTAIRTLVSDRLQVANAAATYQTKSVERAALANTNQFITTVSNRERAALANTNIYIASKVNTTTFNSALANTNAFIKTQLANTNAYIATKPSWSAITSTNTALRTLINDRIQVANAEARYQLKTVSGAALANTNAFIKAQLANTNAYIATKASWTELKATNTAIRGLVSDRLQVSNAAATYQTKAIERAALANTNSYIATKASWAGLAGTNTALRTLISDRIQVANADAKFATKAYAASNSYVNSTFLSKTLNGTSSQTVLSNLVFSANVAIQGKLVVTGGITSYFANNVSTSDNMLYLNSNSTISNPDLGFAGNYNDGTYHHTGFFRDASDSGTWKVFENYALEPDASPYINTAHATFRLAPFAAQNITVARNLTVVANTTVGNTTVGGFLKLNGTDIRATFAQNTSVRLAIADRLQVANARSYMQVSNTKAYLANTNAFIKAQLANTNAYIATKASWTALTGTNTALRTLISDRIQVANAEARYQLKTVSGSALANTNSWIKQQLANTNAYIATKASWTALTGTNTALRTLISDRYQVANVNTLLAAKATWTGLTGTNTAIRALVSDRLQVSNAAATYQTKSIERAALANTNSYIAAQGTRITLVNTNLTGTNTALRTLIDDRLQVANASTLYATKSNPTTSGLLAHTGRATISTNLTVSGNAAVTGTMTASGIVSGLELTSTMASGDEGGQVNLAKPPNATISGGVTIDAYQNKLRIFEQGGSARGVYIDLSVASAGVGTNLLAGGGGGSSNTFSGILVGANVVSADSTSDRLTFVAGSGMTIAADPTTDTITFASTGGGAFTGGTVTGATSFTNTTDATNENTGAVKVSGGLGVAKNIYTGARIGFANTTSHTSVAYTYYNSTTGSLDTVFG